jgi:hypothetical protein
MSSAGIFRTRLLKIPAGSVQRKAAACAHNAWDVPSVRLSNRLRARGCLRAWSRYGCTPARSRVCLRTRARNHVVHTGWSGQLQRHRDAGRADPIKAHLAAGTRAIRHACSTHTLSRSLPASCPSLPHWDPQRPRTILGRCGCSVGRCLWEGVCSNLCARRVW